MKNIFRTLGIIALAAVIGFGTLSCDNDPDPVNNNQGSGLQLPAYPEFNPSEIADSESDTDGDSPVLVTEAQFEDFVSKATIYYVIKEEFLAKVLLEDNMTDFVNTIVSEGYANQDLGEIVSEQDYLYAGITGVDGTFIGSIQQNPIGVDLDFDLVHLCDSSVDTTTDWLFAFGEPNPKPNYWIKAKVKDVITFTMSRNSTNTSGRTEMTEAMTYLGSINLPDYSGKFRFNLARAEATIETAQNPDGIPDGTPLESAQIVFYDNDWNQLYEHVYTKAEMDAYDAVVDGMQE